MWILLAISAAILWGVTYSIDEQIYKHLSIPFTLAIAGLVSFFVMILITLFTGTFSNDNKTLITSNLAKNLLIIGTITFVVAELLIGFSISYKNATLAGMIEISYPIFIALSSYLIFNDNQVSWTTVCGASIIFVGIFIIYFHTR